MNKASQLRQPGRSMPQDASPNPQSDADRLEVATDEAIATCGGNARDAVKALIVANEYLESEVCELMQAVSHAYAIQDLHRLSATAQSTLATVIGPALQRYLGAIGGESSSSSGKRLISFCRELPGSGCCCNIRRSLSATSLVIARV